MSEIEKSISRLEIAKKNKSKEIRLSIFEYEKLINEIITLQDQVLNLSKIDKPKKVAQSKVISLDGQGFK
jgi:predicted RNase H-like nuclease